jgi:ferredoxin-NADP reductase/MOSC domain-containing protein YiiM
VGLGTLLSVNVGMPKDVSWRGETVHTGVWKHPVAGPQMVRRLNVDGDGQGDLEGHGGEQRAVLVYQIDSYVYWKQYFGRDDLEYGAFGENLTVDGLPDHQVCIGDRYRIGEAEFEVTQPRVTCYRVGMRLGETDLPALLVGHHRPGFYMRVLVEGRIQAGDRIIKTRSGPHALSVADTDALLYLPGRDMTRLRAATDIPALSPGWQASFHDLLAAPAGDDFTGVPAARPLWPGFRQLRVTDVVSETPTVSSIYLGSPDETPLPSPKAGQYLTLRIADAGPVSLVRSYSLSSAPGSGTYRISVKREPNGAASGYLTTKVRPGQIFEVAAPRGSFILDEAVVPILLISAGIGVTPVLSMLHALEGTGSNRDIWWLHGARQANQDAMAAEARTLLDSFPRVHEHVYYSAAPADETLPVPAHAGRLTGERLAQLGIPADAEAYICGPASFMSDVQGALVAIGLDPAHIHTELFGALPSVNPGLVARSTRPPHQPLGPIGTGPTVTFARSGISTPFTDAAHSILELAESCDVPTRWACRTGVCHTCITPLLSGEVSYWPDPLEPPPEGQVLICCTRPDTDLVLDM